MKTDFLRMRLLSFGLLSGLSLTSLAVPQTQTQVPPSAQTETKAPWFAGSVEQALAAAKEQKKPVFLYWGAVWCPPCHEIKAQVFSTTRFSELMQQVIPVELDGDSEMAQFWADKLRVSGYPTLLVLKSNGEEIMRYTEAITIDEFEAAFESTIAANRPFKETVSKALKGEATRDDWRLLAFFSWSDPQSNAGFVEDEALALHQKLADLVPKELVAERALLAGSLLERAAGMNSAEAKPATKQTLESIQKQASNYLGALFLSPDSILAARRILLYSAADIVKWLYPQGQNVQGRRQLIAQWKKALVTIHEAPRMSLDTRMTTFYPEIQFERIDVEESAGNQNTKKTPVSPALLARIQAAAAKTDLEATSKYIRHAAVSNAADLLAEAGDLEGGRALLLKELKTTDTPWYIEASLAAVEKNAGQMAEALKWSDASVKSAQGKSTRLQWMAADIMLSLKTMAELAKGSKRDAVVASKEAGTKAAPPLKISKATVTPKIKNYYTLALTLPDGFTGRNAGRQKKLSALLGPWVQSKANRAWLVSTSKQCAQMAEVSKANCTAHFQDVLKAPATAKR